MLEKAPNVPVVILSGQDDEALAIKALNQGVQDYLVKGSIAREAWTGPCVMRWSGRRSALPGDEPQAATGIQEPVSVACVA